MRTKILLTLLILGMGITVNGQIVVSSIDFDDPVSSYPDYVEYFGNLTEVDAFTISGGLLEQRTYSSTGAGYYSFFNNQLNQAQSLAVEAKLNVIQVDGVFGIGLTAADGAHRYTLGINDTGIQLFTNTGVVDFSYSTSGTHTYRIESPASSGTANLFIDGVYFTSFDADPYTAQNGFNFGDGAGNAGNGADVDWDYITVQQDISLSAVPEPSTYTLVSSVFVFGACLGLRRRIKLKKKRVS